MAHQNKTFPNPRLYNGAPCPYCNRTMDIQTRELEPTRDHYPIPKAHGGRRMIICCLKCNQVKADKTADEWHLFMQENPFWWIETKSDLQQSRTRARQRHGSRVYRREAEAPSTPMKEALEKFFRTSPQRG